jgi:hypothetical protein
LLSAPLDSTLFRVPDGEVGEAGDPARGSRFDAVENRTLRRWTDGPPSPGVIRATANNRFDRQLPRATVAIAAAPTLGAPPGPIYPYRGSRRSQVARRQGRPPRRPQPVRTRSVSTGDIHTSLAIGSGSSQSRSGSLTGCNSRGRATSRTRHSGRIKRVKALANHRRPHHTVGEPGHPARERPVSAAIRDRGKSDLEAHPAPAPPLSPRECEVAVY